MTAAWPEGVDRRVLESIDSTNAEAARLAPGLTGPCWIMARHQTAARGRRGRPWANPEGHFSATLVLRPAEPPAEAALRSFVAALALRDALAALTGREAALSLKWPNDVLLNGGKVAGILLESAGQGPTMTHLAIGIGVNLLTVPDTSGMEQGTTHPVSVAAERRAAVARRPRCSNAARPSHIDRIGTRPFMKPRASRRCATAWLARAARLGDVVEARLPHHEGGAQGDLRRSVDETGALDSTHPARRAPHRGGRGSLSLTVPDRDDTLLRRGACFWPSTCGNTNSVFADAWDGAGNSFARVRASRRSVKRTADEYYRLALASCMNHQGVDAGPDRRRGDLLDRAAGDAVQPAGPVRDKYFGRRPVVVGKPDCGATGASRRVWIRRPRVGRRPAGQHRWLGLPTLYGGNLIVVDFGTATTFDVVAADGAYIGGVIAPGVNLSLEALHQSAAALPHVDITMPDSVIGTNTVACMQSGVFWGYIGLVEGIVTRIKQERAREMKVIGTGGLAPLFQQGQTLFDEFEDDLTMHGLTVIHRYNEENPPA